MLKLNKSDQQWSKMTNKWLIVAQNCTNLQKKLKKRAENAPEMKANGLEWLEGIQNSPIRCGKYAENLWEWVNMRQENLENPRNKR